MYTVAYDYFCSHLRTSLANEAARLNVIHLLQRRQRRHQLKSRTRRIGAVQETVDLHAVVLFRIALHIRHIVRIKGG